MSETRKLAAILCADVVGYSRLAGADEDRILARLRALRSDLIDPTIAVHNGRVVKRTGDGSVVEFRSVVDAVRCAIEVQNAMVDRNAGVPEDRRIVWRIGIHVGDVVEESDGDLMGDGVNIAARLEGIAKPGAICLSEDAYRQVSGRLDMAVADLGPTQLKNIERSIRVYSLQVGVPAQAKPATEAKPKRRSVLAPIVAAIVALLIIGAAAWYIVVANRTVLVASNTTPPAGSANLSIVVMPFANLSGDPSQDYLADALTEELTTSISRLHDSFVIARNTAFTYKGKPIDAKAIGKDLGVRYVLEGSVQPSGGEVRVNAQLIDADSGAHIWAEQFDAARAHLLQMQDEIVTHLARAMFLQLPEAEAARLKRTPAANPDAEDLALQCQAAAQKGGYIGKEADAGYRLCERAIDDDPNNIRALHFLSVKFFLPVAFGLSTDTKSDLRRADDLISRALVLDPNYAPAHLNRGSILLIQGRPGEAIPEHEHALALDPALVDAEANLGFDYLFLGQFEKSLEYFDKAIRLSPRDPYLSGWYEGKASAYFGLTQYDHAIEWARRAIAINPNYPAAHRDLIAALALTRQDADAHEALQRYLALHPIGPGTIAAWKVLEAQFSNPNTDPRFLEMWDRMIEGLRKAGMPEAEAPKLSIVVLPLSNLSGDPGQDYLVDALTDELTTGVSRLPGSFVIARRTAFTYKGKPIDAKAIGKELGVRYVLEGSVQPSGGQVRVNAQLIEADSGAHIWADQFDTARTDLLKMQDEIVTRLARALEHQLPEAEAARAKRAPAANPDAEDLALQCWGIVLKNSYFGKEADAGYRLCEQALAIDPNNVRATVYLGVKYYLPILIGRSADAKGDLKKADDLISRALVLDPNFPNAHDEKAWIFVIEKRYDEAVAEEERAIALDPAFIDAVVGLAYNYQFLGQYEKSLEYFDRAIRLSPRDPILNSRYQGKAAAYLALKQYDQAIDWARRAIAVDPNNIATAHATLIAALVLTGREDEAHDALQRYLSPPRGPETIAAWKAYKAVFVNEHSAPRYVEFWDRAIEGLRKAGMAEG